MCKNHASFGGALLRYVDSFCHVVCEKTRIGSLWSPGQKRPEKNPIEELIDWERTTSTKMTPSDNIYRAIKAKVK